MSASAQSLVRFASSKEPELDDSGSPIHKRELEMEVELSDLSFGSGGKKPGRKTDNT